MKASEIVQVLHGAVQAMKDGGIKTVDVANLETLTVELDKASRASPDGVADGEAALEHFKGRLDFERQSSLEMFKSTILAGQAALKSSLLINGGAAAALLAFIGGIWNTPESRAVVVPSLALALVSFVAGVLAAAIASGTTYITQFLYSSAKPKATKCAWVFNALSMIAVAASYGCFGWGAWIAYKAFLR